MKHRMERTGIPRPAYFSALLFCVTLSFRLAMAGSADLRSARPPSPAAATLSDADKADLAEALRLKKELGDRVWPGLSAIALPTILFDEASEFLIGETTPPAEWTVVEGDDYQGEPYFRRAAVDPQAFAVAVGTRWAASISTREYANKKGPFRISSELYVVLVLHEVFHAYQATRNPARFAKAKAVYASESRYPIKDQEFAAAWNREGAALAEALRAADRAATVRSAKRFLDLRASRRERAALDAGLLDFERELEWLEGLAEFVEVKFYEVAASRAREPAFSRYKSGLPLPLQYDFVRLERQLGAQNGDLRFYLSGMALSRLLDRLRPGWTDEVMKDEYNLDDLLRAAVAGRGESPTWPRFSRPARAAF